MARNTHNTKNSQDAAFDAANIPVSLPGGIPVSQPSNVPGSSGDTSLDAATPPLNSMAQLPPVYMAAIAQAVKDAMAAEQAHASCADSAISVPSRCLPRVSPWTFHSCHLRLQARWVPKQRLY